MFDTKPSMREIMNAPMHPKANIQRMTISPLSISPTSVQSVIRTRSMILFDHLKIVVFQQILWISCMYAFYREVLSIINCLSINDFMFSLQQ